MQEGRTEGHKGRTVRNKMMEGRQGEMKGRKKGRTEGRKEGRKERYNGRI